MVGSDNGGHIRRPICPSHVSELWIQYLCISVQQRWLDDKWALGGRRYQSGFFFLFTVMVFSDLRATNLNRSYFRVVNNNDKRSIFFIIITQSDKLTFCHSISSSTPRIYSNSRVFSEFTTVGAVLT